MQRFPENIEVGKVYLLDDFSYVQVTALSFARVDIVARGGVSWRFRLRSRRGMRPELFRRLVRAEVDSAFFPEFSNAGFRHSPREQANSRAVLRSAAHRRPFGAADTDET